MNTEFSNHSSSKKINTLLLGFDYTGEVHLKLLTWLLILTSITVLAGCGGNGKNGDDDSIEYISSKPLSLPLRPGESEQVQATSNIGTDPGSSIHFSKSREINQDQRTPCVLPDPKCRVATYSASNTAQPASLNILEYSFTGQLADVSTLPFSIFPETTQALPPAIRFAAGGDGKKARGTTDNLGTIGHSLAVAADGTVWAWGTNYNGQLGNGNKRDSSIPVQVQHTGTYLAVAAGANHSMAIASDGTVWAWGDNGYGQLGDDTKEDKLIPVQALNLTNIIAIASGYDHSLALKSDGTVWAWGSNNFGKLGLAPGSYEPVTAPTQVLALTNIVAIAAGGNHSLALQSNGSVWAWGSGDKGQTGRPSRSATYATPKVVQNLGFISSIAVGEDFSIALRSDGTVWSWGSNEFNQLGRMSSDTCTSFEVVCSYMPGRVTGLDQVLDIAAGSSFGIARRNDGSVWAWGDNAFGQVAGLPSLGTLVARPVAGLSNVLAIAAGSAHALAMSADDACAVGDGRTGGRLLAWGNNINGSRGDGTAVNWLRPTPVVALGDNASCAGVQGNRIIVFKTGTGDGTIESDAPGLTCVGMICWQSITANSNVTLTAIAGENSEFSDWRWDCAGGLQTMALNMNSVKVCKVRFNPVVTNTPQAAACNDGIDNDDDGLTDLNDPGCSGSEDDSEINDPVGDFTLTISISGSGEVFDNNDNTFACFSDGTANCLQTYTVNNTASLRAVSFEIEAVAFWESGCDNGTGVLEACIVTMDSNKTVTAVMQ